MADYLGVSAQQVASHGQRRTQEILLFEHQAVEQAVLDRRPARKAESSGGLAVEHQHHERIEIECLAVGHDLERYGVHRPELLDPLDDIGQLADLVLAFVGRTLRGGGKDAEAENVDEIEAVHTAAVHPVDGARGDLLCSFERFVRHAERPCEIVGRTCGDYPQRNIQPLVSHGVDHIVDRAVAAGHDHQVDLLVAVERVGLEIDRLRNDLVAVSPEYGADARGTVADLALAGLGVVEENCAFHKSVIA